MGTLPGRGIRILCLYFSICWPNFRAQSFHRHYALSNIRHRLSAQSRVSPHRRDRPEMVLQSNQFERRGKLRLYQADINELPLTGIASSLTQTGLLESRVPGEALVRQKMVDRICLSFLLYPPFARRSWSGAATSA